MKRFYSPYYFDNFHKSRYNFIYSVIVHSTTNTTQIP